MSWPHWGWAGAQASYTEEEKCLHIRKIKQVKKATNFKFWNLPFVKLIAYPSYVHKDQELLRSMKIWNVHLNCFLQKQHKMKRNENDTTLILEKGSWNAWVGSSGLRGGCAVCQPFLCLRQVSVHIRRVASFHLGAGNSRQLFTDKFNLICSIAC